MFIGRFRDKTGYGFSFLTRVGIDDVYTEELVRLRVGKHLDEPLRLLHRQRPRVGPERELSLLVPV